MHYVLFLRNVKTNSSKNVIQNDINNACIIYMSCILCHVFCNDRARNIDIEYCKVN